MIEVSIYALKDPRTDQIRYVGRARNVERRHREHCYYGSPNRKMRQWIVELSNQGLLPVVQVLEVTTDSEARAREHYWLTECSRTGDLLNAISIYGSRS